MTSSWPSPRGEVAKRGWESGVSKQNITTAADLGLRGDIALKTTGLGERTFIVAAHDNEIRGNILSKPRIIKLS